ncbi:MAG: siderophore-interacting protein [Pseudomonadota bacterium]
MNAPSFPHQALADLPGVPYTTLRQVILAQASAGNITVMEDTADQLTVRTAHGLIGLRPGTTAETAGMVAAEDARRLFIMKNTVIQQMRSLMPEVAEAMRWSDGDLAGSLPPNFQFVRATEVVPLGTAFLRVTLQGEDMASYGDDAIHFRLLQPRVDIDPEWPRVAPNGSTVWPDGPGAPHKPVYTARSVDHATHTLVTDVFVHEGGRTTAWAQELLAGDRARRVVGLVGPAGGGLLQVDRVLIATDETGFPAAARLLENLPDGATGAVLLESEHGAACDYPITAPPGLSVRWLARSRGERLGQAALAALAGAEGGTVWFAGERQDARRLREAAKAAGWGHDRLRISAFWKAPD